MWGWLSHDMLQQHTTTKQLLFHYLTFVSSSELFLLACMYVAATHNHNTAAI